MTYNIWMREPEGWQLVDADLDHFTASAQLGLFARTPRSEVEYVMLPDGEIPVGPSIGSPS